MPSVSGASRSLPPWSLSHVLLPQQLSRYSIHRICVGMLIAKVRRRAAAVLSDADCCSDRKVRVECPENASRLCAQRIDSALITSHKHSAAGHGGLAKGTSDSGKAERPFQLQLRHLLR